MKVSIIGATGLVGSSLVEKLLRHSEVTEIEIISRRTLAIEDQKNQEIILPTMSPREVESLESDASIFICCLGTTIKTAGSKEKFRLVDHDLVLSFAKRAGGKESLFIIFALGADEKSSIFYNRVKGEMEGSVSKLNISSINFLRPSLLIGERKEKRFSEGLGISFYHLLKSVVPRPMKKILGTEVEDLNNYLLRHLKDPKAGINIVTDFSV